MEKKVAGAFEIVINCFFTPILYFLILVAIFTTAGLNYAERTTIYTDSAIGNVLLIVGFIFVLLLVKILLDKNRQKIRTAGNRVNQRMLSMLCLAVWAAMMLLLIVSTQRSSGGDQYLVMRTAVEWFNKNWSALAPGGYVNMHPHQSGIILVLYFLTHLAGQHNYLAFQFLNVPALLWSAKILGDEVEERTGNTGYRTGLYVGLMMFLPLCFYSTFVYGSLVSLAHVLAAFRQFVLFRRNHKIRHAVFCPLLLLLAVVLKKNSMVFGIGIVLYMAYSAMKDRSWRPLTVMIPVLAVLLFHGNLVQAGVYGITGQTYGEGAAAISYVQMGAMENNSRYDGWYNSYNADTYRDNGCDTAAQTEVVMADFRERLSQFRQNPWEAFCFFLRKNVSQWGDPTFGCLWMNEMMEMQHVVSPPWINNALNLSNRNGRWSGWIRWMNAVQTLILFGALLFLLGMNTGGERALFLKTVLVGGFVFHTFWEANSQYTFPYFVLLIPLAAEGYGQLIRLLSSGKEQMLKDKGKRWKLGIGTGILMLAILAIRLANVPQLINLFRFD